MTTLKNIETIGGKAQNLIKLVELGYRVPSFLVLSNADLVNNEKNALLDLIKKQIPNVSGKRFAVRSSADLEDGDKHSFAGLFSTQLNVPYDQLLDAVTSVLESSSSDQVAAYINAKEIDKAVKMSVIIQEMVEADVSGVAFSMLTTEKETGVVINSVYGLGEALVSGAVLADQYMYDDSGIKADITNKVKALRPAEKGNLTWCTIDEQLSMESSLSYDQVKEIAEVLLQLSADYDCHVDIEFCIKNELLYLLQVRPVTANVVGQKKDNRIVWDNSNIIESYPGITSPLTFSFIRHMYEVVYTQFAGMLGTNDKTLAQSKPIYANMLGHLNGRVYYNLKSWYSALAMVPGYKLNAPFMEKMMGVKESFELENERKISKSSAWWQSLISVFKLIWSFVRLKSTSNKFMKFSDNIIQEYKTKTYKEMSTIQMIKEYKSFEEVLSHKWKAPLINDFFAMILFGALSKWTEKLTPNNPQTINDLLIGSQDIVSIQPLKKSLHITKFIKETPSYRMLFELDSVEIVERLNDEIYTDLNLLIINYLDEFGDRCPEELKLETRTYNQEPAAYIDILKSYLEIDLERFEGKGSDQRTATEALCLSKLKGSFFKRMLFGWVLGKTRYLVSNRENLRFQRTKGYGVVRTIFNEIGIRFFNKNLIEEQADLFYLTKEEIFDFVNGTSIDTNLKHIISSRKTDYERYASLQMKDRITTYGIVNENDIIDHSSKFSSSNLKGVGCCAGVVESKVTVITDPNCIDSLDNTILVTRFTDPGWVRLFPSAAAIIVEKGSLLSHSAIVARELGIPCIVAVDGLMESLTTGDTVIMDGSTGLISKID